MNCRLSSFMLCNLRRKFVYSRTWKPQIVFDIVNSNHILANGTEKCQEENQGLSYMINLCTFKFSMIEPDFKEYSLTFTISSFIEGYHQPLRSSFARNIMLEFPKALFVDFEGPPFSNDTMEVVVHYPYSFGIKVMVWMSPWEREWSFPWHFDTLRNFHLLLAWWFAQNVSQS